MRIILNKKLMLIMLIIGSSSQSIICQEKVKLEYDKLDCLSKHPVINSKLGEQITYTESQMNNDHLLEEYLSSALNKFQQQKLKRDNDTLILKYLVNADGRINNESVEIQGLKDKDLQETIKNRIIQIQYVPNYASCRTSLQWQEEKRLWIEYHKDKQIRLVVKDEDIETYSIRMNVAIYKNFEKQEDSDYELYVEVDPLEEQKNVIVKSKSSVIGKLANIERASGILTLSIIDKMTEFSQDRSIQFKKIYDLDCDEYPKKEGVYLYGLNDCIGKLTVQAISKIEKR